MIASRDWMASGLFVPDGVRRKIPAPLLSTTRCHKNVVLIAMNADKSRTKGEQRRRK